MEERVNASAAPGELEIVRAFVNTLDIEAGTDELANPAEASAWLGEHGRRVRVTKGDLRELIELREALRDLVSERGTPAERRAAAAVDRIAARHPLSLRLSGGDENPLAPSAGGVGGFLGRVLGIVVAAIIDGSWDRMKACRNDGCRWLFFDHSRNRSRAWCTMDLCGSQAKMRAYRGRRRAAIGLR